MLIVKSKKKKREEKKNKGARKVERDVTAKCV